MLISKIADKCTCLMAQHTLVVMQVFYKIKCEFVDNNFSGDCSHVVIIEILKRKSINNQYYCGKQNYDSVGLLVDRTKAAILSENQVAGMCMQEDI